MSNESSYTFSRILTQSQTEVISIRNLRMDIISAIMNIYSAMFLLFENCPMNFNTVKKRISYALLGWLLIGSGQYLLGFWSVLVGSCNIMDGLSQSCIFG